MYSKSKFRYGVREKKSIIEFRDVNFVLNCLH